MKLPRILPLGILVALCACSHPQSDTEYPSGQLPSRIERTADVMNVKGAHIFLLDDYDFEQMTKDNKGPSVPGGCSEVRKGNYVVRNLDWYQLDEPVYIMRVGKTDKHLASIQVCGLDDKLTHESDIMHLTERDLNLKVGNAMDGMNSAGLYVGINVCPFGEMSDTEGDGAIQYEAVEGGVNADKRPLSISYLLRLLLDQATSIEEAKKIIVGTSWTDCDFMQKAGFQLHWLVGTKDASFVCEFIDSKPVFIDAASPNSADPGNIMTNFSNYLFMKGKYQNHGAGYERYEVLKSRYADSEGIEGAKDLARSVFYSKTYSLPISDPQFFWSEWPSDLAPAPIAMTWKDESKRQGAAWENFLTSFEQESKNWDWRQLGYDKRGDNFRGAWYTTHSSIWNLEEKSLVLDIEEQNLFKISVDFDGHLQAE